MELIKAASRLRPILLITESDMYFRTLPILTALALVAAPALVSQAASPKSEIQSTYNQIASAFKSKNVNKATSYFASGYVNTNSQGVSRSAADLRDYYTPLLRPVTVSSSQIFIQSFSAEGNQAEVVAKQVSNMKLGSNKIVYETTSRDTWVRTSAGWRIQESQEISVNNTVNGRPAN